MEAIAINTDKLTWHAACRVEDIPQDGGACALIDGRQIAIFNFARRGEWYATDNECPHRQQMAIGRGMIGSQGEEPKVACPFHKRTFSLKTGHCLNDDGYRINTFPVKVEQGVVFVGV
ncbi:nitrite reductase small subunit NirD [Spirosoma sp. BT702]|uniref:Nitrite reductase small subunit NirD n=1 Tax=Spirosoma profusum TaxID=2771354 RepID=A0A927ASD3_9BACT|nr:nitrite reductase small subunit NirD [Spirosoma profusum]MBD2703661.1 nitrite reductase small subunit NirD [Spirosoma profusum]